MIKEIDTKEIIAVNSKNTNTDPVRLMLLFFHELLGGEYGVVQCTAPNSEQHFVIRLIDDLLHNSLTGPLPSAKVWEAAGLRANLAAALPMLVMPLTPVGESSCPDQIAPSEQDQGEKKDPIREALREQRAKVHRQYLAGQRACLAAQGAADSVYGWQDYNFPNLAVQSYVLAWHYHTGKPVEKIEKRCLAMLFELASVV